MTYTPPDSVEFQSKLSTWIKSISVISIAVISQAKGLRKYIYIFIFEVALNDDVNEEHVVERSFALLLKWWINKLKYEFSWKCTTYIPFIILYVLILFFVIKDKLITNAVKYSLSVSLCSLYIFEKICASFWTIAKETEKVSNSISQINCQDWLNEIWTRRFI